MAVFEAKKGNLLIAEPFLGDSNFERAVIFLCEHNEAGSFGLVLSQTMDLRLEDVLDGVYGTVPLYIGGPVEPNTLHFLHRIPEQIEGSVEVCEGLYFSGNFEQVKQLINLGLIPENDIRFFVGYSGWGEGQLDAEMKQNTWMSTTVNIDYIFDTPAAELWRLVLRNMGGDFKVLANYPIDPRLN